jgi:hypothetical protein
VAFTVFSVLFAVAGDDCCRPFANRTSDGPSVTPTESWSAHSVLLAARPYLPNVTGYFVDRFPSSRHRADEEIARRFWAWCEAMTSYWGCTMSLNISERRIDDVTVLTLAGRLVLDDGDATLRERVGALVGKDAPRSC